MMKSYPVLPDYAPYKKIEAGNQTVGNVLSEGIASLDSIIPSASVTIIDHATEGPYLSKLLINGCDIRFRAHTPFKVVIRNIATGAFSYKTHADFDSKVITAQNSTSFTLTYTDTSTNSEVVITGALNTTSGVPHLSLSYEATLSGADATGNSLWAVEIGRLLMEPIGLCDSINTFQPFMNGMIDTQSLDPYAIAYGFQQAGNRASTPSAYSPTDATSLRNFALSTATLPLVAHFSTSSGVGVAIRCDDITNRGKIICYDGSRGTAMESWVIAYPENNLVATSFSSPYSIQVIPYRGDLSCLVNHHRTLLEEASASWLQTTPIHQLLFTGLFGGTNISKKVVDSAYVAWVAPHSASGSKTDGEVDARLNEELSRIESYFGTNLELLYYSWGADSAGLDRTLSDNMFDHRPTAIAEAVLNAKSYPVYLYHITQVFGETSVWFTTAKSVDAEYGYTDADGDPADYRVIDEDGDPRQVPNENGLTTSFMNPGHSEARSHIVDILSRVADPAEGYAAFEGFYFDAENGSAGDNLADYRATLSASEKGPGSNFYALGKALLFGEIKTAMRAFNAAFVLYSEFPEEQTVGKFDMVSMPADLIDATTGRLNHRYPFFTMLYSRYQAFFSYSAYVEPGVIYDSAYSEILALQSAYQHHCGMKLCFGWFGRFNNHIIMEEGDSGYDASWVQSGVKTLREFQKVLVTDRGANNSYTGKRLRAPVGSFEYKLERKGMSGSLDATTNTIVVGDDEAVASMWEVNDLSWGRRLILNVTNHEQRDKEVRIRISREEFPELGTGQIYVYEGFTLIKVFRDATYFDVSMAAGSHKKFDITDRDLIGEGDGGE